MNIFFNNKIHAQQSLLTTLFGTKQFSTTAGKKTSYSKRDTVTISNDAKVVTSKIAEGRTHNTNIDKSIDLNSYITAAKNKNQQIIENSGTEINATSSEYMSVGKAFREALTEKYSKLVSEAKSHSNPESYIYCKYYDKGSNYYEINLNDTERRVAYNYEMQMYRTGKINGVNYQDSLFRGITVSGDVVDSNKIQFERQLVSSQISNILKEAGINSNLSDCTFSVNPYSYEISVDGVNEDTKALIESTLNMGNNGKNLFNHIYKCATQDGCNSTQVTKASKMKYEAYQQVYSFTGYKLNTLAEQDDKYTTESGENILDLVDYEIDASGEVPNDFKKQMKDWIHELFSFVTANGWKNIPDMNLKILYTANGLKDLNQSIIYQYDKSSNAPWYSVM